MHLIIAKHMRPGTFHIYLICLITFEYYVNGSFERTLLAYLFRNVYNDNLENLTAGVARSRNVRILKFSHGND